jgi:hypothetical protein
VATRFVLAIHAPGAALALMKMGEKGTMANIYLLVPRSPAANRTDQADDTTATRSAEIILFTGVRYERWTDAADTTSTPAKQLPCGSAKGSAKG